MARPRTRPGFANLVANPVATVEVGEETFTARARVTEGDERDGLWAEHVAAHPGIDAFDEWPARVIPVVVLERLETAVIR